MRAFIDEAKIAIKAGDGGDGRVSFRHLKYVPKGGPDGGDGGRGGSVYVRVNPNLNTLSSFRHKRKYHAEDGEPGGKSDMHGANGNDIYIEVPIGTIIKVIDSKNGNDIGRTIEMLTHGQVELLAEGGRGGRGNRNFATPRVQAPRMSTPGIKTDSIELSLELKLLADVGLVGLPNAGKSTLLSLISSAKPEIANYPFTTLEPNLGVVSYDGQTVVVADIPGLIEGASQGKGLGDAFLKHVERTSVLIHLVSLEASEEDLREQFEVVRGELDGFNPDLLDKPYVILLTKSDLVSEEELVEAKRQFADISDVEVLSMSSTEPEQIKRMAGKMIELVSRYKEAAVSEMDVAEEKGTPVYTFDTLKHTYSTRNR